MMVSKKSFLRILNSFYTINFNIYNVIHCYANLGYLHVSAWKTYRPTLQNNQYGAYGISFAW